MNFLIKLQRWSFGVSLLAMTTVSVLLSGCGGQNSGLMSGQEAGSQKLAAPVNLLRNQATSSQSAGAQVPTSVITGSMPNATTSLSPKRMVRVKHSLNQRSISRAIRNYQISKKQPIGPYRVMGADLNSNGQGEALVLFTGKTWCAPTGCTLAVFARTDRGYRIISLTRRVKAPIFVARSNAFGWRGITVDTGIKDKTLQSVELKFNGARYPGNATLVQRIPGRGGDKGELLIGADANPAEAIPSQIISQAQGISQGMASTSAVSQP